MNSQSGPILFCPFLKNGPKTRAYSFHFVDVYFCILVQVELNRVATQQQIESQGFIVLVICRVTHYISHIGHMAPYVVVADVPVVGSHDVAEEHRLKLVY